MPEGTATQVEVDTVTVVSALAVSCVSLADRRSTYVPATPKWAAVEGYHHFGANYQLINDNLLDLSHESFVHEETIGNESVAESPASVTLHGDMVRVHRDMLDIEAPPFYRRTTGFTGRINRWHTNHFTPPGFHIIENGSMPADALDKSHALERKVLNLITPETRTSSHYFWGIVRQFRRDDRALDDTIREGIVRTFNQDKAMLEAQQRAIGPDPDNVAFPVSIRVDAGKSLGELKPIWRFFGADEPNYAYMQHGKKLLTELGEMRPNSVYFRTHNLLCSGDGDHRVTGEQTGVERWVPDRRGAPSGMTRNF